MDEDLLIKYGADKTSECQYCVLDTGIKFSEPIKEQRVTIIYLWISAGFLKILHSQYQIVSFNSDDGSSSRFTARAF